MAMVLARRRLARNLSPLVLAFSLLAVSLPAEAARPRVQKPAKPALSMTDIIRVNYSNSEAAAELNQWLYLKQEKNNASFADYASFMAEHRDWPQRDLLAKRAEDKLTGRETAAILISHFSENKPRGLQAARAYMTALRDEGRSEEANVEVKRFWIYGDMSTAEQAAYAERNENLISTVEIAQRADRLVWDGETTAAQALGTLLSNSARGVITARINIRANKGDPVALASGVSDTYINDPGLIHDQARAYATKDQEHRAAPLLLRTSETGTGHAEAWWKLRDRVARSVLEDGDAATAYKIMRQHGLKPSDEQPYRDCEWLAGFIALRFLNDPGTAIQHFNNVVSSSTSIIMLARGYYWLGRSHAAAGNTSLANSAYEKAVRYPTVYEAQAAAIERYGEVNITLPESAEPSAAAKAAFNNRPLVQVVRAAVQMNNASAEEFFMRALGDSATSQEEATLTIRLGKELKRPGLAVLAALRVGSKGFIAGREGYPTIALNRSSPSPAFVHSITRRESLFNTNAKSPVGALGMMQLMPGTATRTASKLGVRHSTGMLTSNPAHNMTLGSVYLGDMLEMFGTPAMAAAAYNAGPGRLLGLYNRDAGKIEDGWLCRLGDPRQPDFNMRPIYDTNSKGERVQLDRCNGYTNALNRLYGARATSETALHKAMDWVEMISFGETRDYARHIVAGYNMYEGIMAKNSQQARLHFAEKLVR